MMIGVYLVIGIFAGGAMYALGLVDGMRRGRALVPEPVTLNPACGCGHHLSLHDPKERTCRREIKKGLKWTLDGKYMTEYRWIRCPCRQFVPEDGQLAVSGVTPAELARQKGYDPDYVKFLEDLQERTPE